MKILDKKILLIIISAIVLTVVIIFIAVPNMNMSEDIDINGDTQTTRPDVAETHETSGSVSETVKTTEKSKPEETTVPIETAPSVTEDKSDDEYSDETDIDHDFEDDIGNDDTDNNETGNADPDNESGSTVTNPDQKDVKVKAVYLNAGAAGTPDVIDYIIDLARTTELNAVVIDIKDGPIYYKSDVPYAVEYGLFTSSYNPESVISKLHENDIYVIGRLVCFRDPMLASKRPDLAIRTKEGLLWKENGNTPWTNPYNPDVHRYLLDLAIEAVNKGFDEIQLDYVRFPTGTGGKDFYGENIPTKVEAINKFLEFAVTELKPYGVKVSADIFGIVGLSVADGKHIGQELESVGMNIDYICPMVYPSHYANGTNKVMGNGVGTILNGILYEAPDLFPYEIIFGTLKRMKERLDPVEGYKAGMRPYLQAFTASYLPSGYYQKYGAVQIRQQIQAVYDVGYEEWILWDHNSKYPREAFLPKDEIQELSFEDEDID